MRKETREYKFDWMLWTMFDAGAKIKKGFPKEYSYSLNYMPYYRGVIEPMLATGDPGQKFIECCAAYLDNLVHSREKGFKTAITTFCFSPAILYAMDIVPVCLEILSVMQTLTSKRGTTEHLDFCNEVGYTETSCSSQRGSLGAYLAGNGAEIDMIVTDTPGVCDTNANAFAFAAAYLDKPFFSLDMPPELNGSRSDAYHLGDFKALIAFLEKHSGHKLDIDKLRTVMQRIQKQDELVAELEDLARLRPSPMPVTYNFMVHASRFLFAGMPECTACLESMLAVAKENAAAGRSGLASGVEKLRSFWCYIDHYTQNLRLWQMLEENNICYQGNILSRSWAANAPHVKEYGTEVAAYELDLKDLDGMIRSLALLNSRMPMIKSIRGPYDAKNMWLEDTVNLAKLHGADFIVYNGTPGCRNTWGMVKMFARDTEKAGFPTYIMYADAFDDRVESWEATKERFEEFLTVRGLL
jgi:benzoyl-CoA reductase/2-hydroxyglutaryl-CoA dehydratase subunit BcrC/BadD/HgdB